MDTPLLERRMLLRGAGVAGASLAGVAAGAQPASARHERERQAGRHRLLGSWLITHTDRPPSPSDPGISVVGFAPGGLLVTQDIAPVGAAGGGSWRARDNGRFRASFWSGFPGQDDGAGGLLRVSVRGRATRDRVSGAYRAKVYDAKRQKVLDSFRGTFRGTRIRP
jgi:hypothetical protein